MINRKLSFLGYAFFTLLIPGIILLIFPIPVIALEIIMLLNIIAALVLLFMVLVKKSSRFSILPTVLLLFTIYNLAINVAITRPILVKGPEFDGFLIGFISSLVTGFGNISLITGSVVLIICLIIVFLLFRGICKISRVYARFTMDALPGKQMIIDNEYNQGVITQEEAAKRKYDLQQESDFSGSLEGALKFAMGNEKVRIFIVLVNSIGGILIGTLLRNEAAIDGVYTYISLAIGAGLLSMLPGVFLSLAVVNVIKHR